MEGAKIHKINIFETSIILDYDKNKTIEDGVITVQAFELSNPTILPIEIGSSNIWGSSNSFGSLKSIPSFEMIIKLHQTHKTHRSIRKTSSKNTANILRTSKEHLENIKRTSIEYLEKI